MLNFGTALLVAVVMLVPAFFSGLFSCSRLRGTQGAHPNTTAQVWALAEVCGTWGFKVASNHGEAFRTRRAIQAYANPRTRYRLKKGPTAHVLSLIHI